MMYTELKKLHLIEFLLKENDENVLNKVEHILIGNTAKSMSNFNNFSNVLSADELNIFEKNINDGCEQINENDWK